MSRNIIALWTTSALPALVRAFCQLSYCSSSTNVRPNCPLSTFEPSETYRPLDQIAPPLNDPYHMFNLIYDHSKNDCINVGIGTSLRSDLSPEPFRYSLGLSCRSEIPIFVSLEMEGISDSETGSVTCFYPINESLQMAKRCGIFAKERIRMNFARDQGLLLMEDLTRQGHTKAWLMLQKRKHTYGGNCTCTKLARFRALYDQCFQKVFMRRSREKQVEGNRLEFGLKLIIGSAMCCLFLLVLAYLWIVSDCPKFVANKTSVSKPGMTEVKQNPQNTKC